MFDIGWDEMAVVAVVALVVIGPKDLPAVLHQLGQWTRKLRLMAAEFQHSVDDMVRESELDKVKAQVEKATDPNLLRQEIEKTIDPTGDIARSLEPPMADSSGGPTPAQDGEPVKEAMADHPPIIELDAPSRSDEPAVALVVADSVKPPQP